MFNFLLLFIAVLIIELIRRFVFPTCYLIEIPSEEEKKEIEEEKKNNEPLTPL